MEHWTHGRLALGLASSRLAAKVRSSGISVGET
jgi:hypothetical protein